MLSGGGCSGLVVAEASADEVSDVEPYPVDVAGSDDELEETTSSQSLP